MIQRTAQVRLVKGLLDRNPVVAILGARQVGKTTLARQVVARCKGPSRTFDMETDRDRAIMADPMRFLEPLRGIVVIDEVQNAPDIFRTLRVLADRPRRPARFLVLGSANESLLRQTSESLAGRIAYHDLEPLGLDETGLPSMESLWLRGGFPLSFLAASDEKSLEWRLNFIRTFVQRDLPELGVTIPSATIARFWSMLAHVHGQVWNGSAIASGFGVSLHTVRRWLDLLRATYVVRLLPPWHENLAKRQVKSPKVFIADTGLVHALHDIPTIDRLEGHPVVGASWESFGIQTVVRRIGARADQCYFWGTQQGAELDLLVVAGGRRLGFEFKRSSIPKVTPSMRIALADLRLERLVLVYAGDEVFDIGEGIRAVPCSRLLTELKPLSKTG
jgi:predicted AAA+ superfamily ATPase